MKQRLPLVAVNALLLVATLAGAQTYSVLYAFKGTPDGDEPSQQWFWTKPGTSTARPPMLALLKTAHAAAESFSSWERTARRALFIAFKGLRVGPSPAYSGINMATSMGPALGTDIPPTVRCSGWGRQAGLPLCTSLLEEPQASPSTRATMHYDGVTWLTVYMNTSLALRALANERRLQILNWLKDPTKHFPPQVDGDLVKDGVCGVLIARKLSISQPTASEHLKILCQAGLIRPKRIKKWTFYKRDEAKINLLKTMALAKL